MEERSGIQNAVAPEFQADQDYVQTVDTNSAYFAKFCFGLGINLKRIEVIADDEQEIVEATRRMSDNYDLVVTSGGIGPT